MNTLTPAEQAVITNNVAQVNAAIAAAAAARVANKTVETPEQTKVRLATEKFDLSVANQTATPEQKFHFFARNQRVKVVMDKIAAAALVRAKQLESGTMESPGVQLDRLAQEDKELTEAAVVNLIEPFGVESTNLDIILLAKKLNEVIKFLNHQVVVAPTLPVPAPVV